jgi:SAM-dependent methyltransferase
VAHPFAEYARCYDLIYKDKDYAAESRFISLLLEEFLRAGPSEIRVLDLACGTGRHSRELAQMGYRVDGSDASAEMVAIARARTEQAHLPISFFNERFQTCDRIGKTYDAVIAMFASINYLTEYRDLARTLDNIRGLLRPDGVFVFDFWNGTAVTSAHSPIRERRGEEGDESVIRISNTTLEPLDQIARVHFDFTVMRAGLPAREFSEDHTIRYFFPREMRDLLEASGFETLLACPFMERDRPLSTGDWNVTYVARPCT